MKEMIIQLNGLSHQIYTWGDSSLPCLFMIHGWLDSGLSFQFLAEELAEQFYCIAPDLRGFGKTEHCLDPIGYFFEQYFCDIHDLLNQFSAHKKVFVLGHSMGGILLSYYCGAFPDRVEAFINLEGLGTRSNRTYEAPDLLRNWVLSRGQLPYKVFLSRQDYKTRFLRRNPGVPDKKLEFIMEGLLRKLPVEEQWTLRADSKHFMPSPSPFFPSELHPFLKKTRAKCLVVVGTHSHYLKWIGVSTWSRMALKWRFRHLRRFQLLFIEGAGHMLHLGDSQELGKVVIQFLNSSEKMR